MAGAGEVLLAASAGDEPEVDQEHQAAEVNREQLARNHDDRRGLAHVADVLNAHAQVEGEGEAAVWARTSALGMVTL